MSNVKFARRCPEVPVRKLPSRTIPGQSLIPAELLKRHLAGTLPDIAMGARYTHDEDGNQVDENLQHMELHELKDLAERVREAVRERNEEIRAKNQSAYDDEVIARYKASLETAIDGSNPPGNKPGEGGTDQIPAP